MKKAGLILVMLTVIICIFLCGFLVGRNFNRTNIQISDIPVSPLPTTTKVSHAKININTASVEELSLLPGIGTKLAQRIVDYRDTIGPFTTASDLCNVNGIGEQKLLSILDYIMI